MKPLSLVAVSLSAAMLVAAAADGADVYSCTISPTSSTASYSMNASAPFGGTMIGDAIRKTLKDIFDEQDAQFQDIVLITDGGDQESFAVEAAREWVR